MKNLHYVMQSEKDNIIAKVHCRLSLICTAKILCDKLSKNIDLELRLLLKHLKLMLYRQNYP